MQHCPGSFHNLPRCGDDSSALALGRLAPGKSTAHVAKAVSRKKSSVQLERASRATTEHLHNITNSEGWNLLIVWWH